MITSRWKRAMLGALPILMVLIVAVTLFTWLLKTRPVPERRLPIDARALVEVMEAQPTDVVMTVVGRGEVLPGSHVSLQSEIGGDITWLNERFTEGGLVKRGEVLLRLDNREHQLAIQEHAADVESARLALREEEARARVARREHTILGKLGERAARSELALREPQLEAARAALSAAESRLERARLHLSKTSIRAPFDALVGDKGVSLGQYVAPGRELASLVGTENFRIRATLLPAEATLVQPGSTAFVFSTLQARKHQGYVLRLLGDLDPTTKLARVLVEVPDPLGAMATSIPPPRPLLLGSFVEVEMEAGVLERVFVLPCAAIRSGERVYVKDERARLRFRDVSVAWRDREDVMIDSGLEAGDVVVVSPLPGAVEGMLLRTRDQEAD